MIHSYNNFLACCCDAREVAKNEFIKYKYRTKVICITTASHFHVLLPQTPDREIYQISLIDAYQSIMNDKKANKRIFLPLIGIKCRHGIDNNAQHYRDALAEAIQGKK